MKYDRMDAKPEDKKVIPRMEPISYLSDANKLDTGIPGVGLQGCHDPGC